MDTTKNYILMAEKAFEVQELWEPDVGDYFKIRNEVDGHVNVLGCHWEKCDGCEWEACKEESLWIPTQSQLQGMVKDRFKVSYGIDLYHLVKCFQIFQVKHTGGLGLTSMEQLWISFVMKEKFSKHWTGSEWK